MEVHIQGPIGAKVPQMIDTMIRAATVDDARGIAEVHVGSWTAAYRDLVDLSTAGDRPDVDARTRAWRERIPAVSAEGFRTWVAERDSRIIGFSFTRPTEDEDLNPLEIAEVVALYVDPEHFGRGTGKALLDRAVAGIRNQGFLQGTLWVLEENTRAIHFYRRAGWRPDGARSECHRALGAPAIRLRLPL